MQVTERALLQRINRKLGPQQNEKIVACRRTSRSWPTLGDFYGIDVSMSTVTRHNVDLEALGKELGVLKGYEEVVLDS